MCGRLSSIINRDIYLCQKNPNKKKNASFVKKKDSCLDGKEFAAPFSYTLKNITIIWQAYMYKHKQKLYIFYLRGFM